MSVAAIFFLAQHILSPALASQTCLAATVYLEARGEPVIGQWAVAEVVLRRRDSGRWGKTTCSVVLARKQFAPTLVPPDYPVNDLAAWKRAWEIAGESLRNWKEPTYARIVVARGATHFVALKKATPAWATGAPVRVIGDHTFYNCP